MTVVVTENVPPALRGRLAIWMVEIRPGVYVAQLTQRLRRTIWETLRDGLGEGNAVMVWRTNTEAGYDIAELGVDQRRPVDLDGLKLMAFSGEEVSQ